MLKKLYDGKGIEWYHLVAVAVVVYFIGFSNGTTRGVLDTQRCDSHEILLDNKEFVPSSITIHPCETLSFKNNDNTRYDILDEFNNTIRSVGVGQVQANVLPPPPEYTYHTDKYPEIMTLQVIVK